jgi:hypothetical protein
MGEAVAGDRAGRAGIRAPGGPARGGRRGSRAPDHGTRAEHDYDAQPADLERAADAEDGARSRHAGQLPGRGLGRVPLLPDEGLRRRAGFRRQRGEPLRLEGQQQLHEDETSTDFVQTVDGQRRDVEMTAKDEGGCRIEPSYNVWLIEAYQGQQLISRGLVYVGHTVAGLPYSAECRTFHLTKNFSCSSAGLSLEVGRADQPPPPPSPACPSGGERCFITLHFDTNMCPNFTASVGACTGTAQSNSFPFQVPVHYPLRGSFAGFSWGPSHVFVKYGAVQGFAPFAGIDGQSGGGPTTDFRVNDAWALASPYPGVHWYTPDHRGVPAGEPGGGPLLLSFKNGTFGADVYIRGYLDRKP